MNILHLLGGLVPHHNQPEQPKRAVQPTVNSNMPLMPQFQNQQTFYRPETGSVPFYFPQNFINPFKATIPAQLRARPMAQTTHKELQPLPLYLGGK